MSKPNFYETHRLMGDDFYFAEFDGLSECVAASKAINPRAVTTAIEERSRTGYAPVVARSEALLSKMEEALDLSGLQRATVPAVAGGVANVPAFLSGSPMAMRRRQVAAREAQGEIVLFLNTYAGWAFAGSDAIERRGAALLALTRALSTMRPVRLFLFEATGSRTMILIRVEAAPLDLSRAAWATGTTELTLETIVPIQTSSRDPNNLSPMSDERSAEILEAYAKARFGAHAALVTPRITGDQFEWRGDGDAARWVKEKLAAFSDFA